MPSLSRWRTRSTRTACGESGRRRSCRPWGRSPMRWRALRASASPSCRCHRPRCSRRSRRKGSAEPESRMARVVLVGNLAQLTGGVAEFVLSATSVKQLFQQLSELHPALARHLEDGVAVAIDGQIYQDALLEPIGPDSEVFLLPQIAGGLASA